MPPMAGRLSDTSIIRHLRNAPSYTIGVGGAMIIVGFMMMCALVETESHPIFAKIGITGGLICLSGAFVEVVGLKILEYQKNRRSHN